MRVAVLPLFLSGVVFAACVPPESGGSGGTGGSGGSGSSSTGGRGGSGSSTGGSGGSASAGSGGSAGSTAGTGGSGSSTGGSGGSGSSTGGSGGNAGSTAGSGGSGNATGGSGGSSAGDASAPDDTASTPEPTAPGAFPGCPKCKSIFDGKTLEGWQQDPAGSFVVKEGTIASTGKGAHAWTMDDYGDYRIIFSVRQISGNHKPCTTLFTTRPANGKAARGLSGLQFQPPLGGSWDYRPGKNSGPDTTHWTYPNPRPMFDVKKWHRCEIVARASTGEFRGACCEIEGKDSCKGLEVVRYKDATAGKKGPFALMMHNGGLFDEFKDFWVETDPVGDELVTMK